MLSRFVLSTFSGLALRESPKKHFDAGQQKITRNNTAEQRAYINLRYISFEKKESDICPDHL
jgi:hypothetical protein